MNRERSSGAEILQSVLQGAAKPAYQEGGCPSRAERMRRRSSWRFRAWSNEPRARDGFLEQSNRKRPVIPTSTKLIAGQNLVRRI